MSPRGSQRHYRWPVGRVSSTHRSKSGTPAVSYMCTVTFTEIGECLCMCTPVCVLSEGLFSNRRHTCVLQGL